MNDRTSIGHNGGPALYKLSAEQKVERIKGILEMADLTPAQKCAGVGIIVEADQDGSAEVTTKQLQLFASAYDKETIYRATKMLAAKGVVQPIREKGRPNRFRVMPPQVTEAIIDAFHELRSSRVQPDKTSPVEPVGLNPTSPVEPVGLNPTSPVEPVGLNPTTSKERSPHTPLKEKINIYTIPSELRGIQGERSGEGGLFTPEESGARVITNGSLIKWVDPISGEQRKITLHWLYNLLPEEPKEDLKAFAVSELTVALERGLSGALHGWLQSRVFNAYPKWKTGRVAAMRAAENTRRQQSHDAFEFPPEPEWAKRQFDQPAKWEE